MVFSSPGCDELKGHKNLAGSTHEIYESTEAPKGSSDRSFGLVFVGVFALVGIWPAVVGTSGFRIWALVVAGALLIVSLTVPACLAPANKAWTRFGLLLHHVVNPLVMGLLFFLTVTPTALIIRALGKDPLRREFDPDARTYWIDRTPHGPSPESMTEQF